MQRVFALDETNSRKLRFLYRQSGIESRHSVIDDYSRPASGWQFYSPTENLEPFPTLEKRMEWYNKYAAPLSVDAVRDCLAKVKHKEITHLITVSCTGMSAPGLDLELLEMLDLPLTTNRTSINFMGCYAAIHAMKIADAYCKSDPNANVLIVCTELCTLHFQREPTMDNLTSSMLFSDGAAAMLINNDPELDGMHIDHFYSSVKTKGKPDMAWKLSSSGFQMTLSGYIPELIEEDFDQLVEHALGSAGLSKNDVTHWCIHPGGKKILESVNKSLGLMNGELDDSYHVLRDKGNMSSPTVLFVLEEISKRLEQRTKNKIFGAAFGPGLTMETFILST